MTRLAYEATIRLENELNLFSDNIYQEKSKLAGVVEHYQNRKLVEAFNANFLCNTAVNVGLLLCLANWLI
ncbi:hypothetical protein N8878_02235 [Psychromonas sp.]|nr:hypothetical protein [Psychromonas sp.]